MYVFYIKIDCLYVLQITQSQDELSTDMSTMFTVEEPSQSDLEDELKIINEDKLFPVPRGFSMDISDPDLENELEEILKEDNSGDASGLSDLLDGMVCFLFKCRGHYSNFAIIASLLVGAIHKEKNCFP